MAIINEKINLTSNKITKDYAFCLLADIHNTKYIKIKLWNKVIQKVKEQNPDYTFISGDIIYEADDLKDIKTKEKLEYLLNGLSAIAPLFISIGNHDLKDSKLLKAKDTLNYLKSLENDRIHVLNNETFSINEDITIVGFSPRLNAYYPTYKEHRVKYFIEDLLNSDFKYDKNKYIILLSHSPEVVKELSDNIDRMIVNAKNKKDIKKFKAAKKILEDMNLVLCGHMHDGNIPHWIQKIGIVRGDIGIAAFEGQSFKNTFCIVRYCRGVINVFNAKAIISRGVIKWSQPNFLFNLIGKGIAKDITTIYLKK
jgi:predicted MPP superfamily phosphohydrolase